MRGLTNSSQDMLKVSGSWFHKTIIVKVRIADPTTGAGSSGMSAVATMVGVPTDTRLSPTPIHDAPAITLRPGNRLKRSYAHLSMSARPPSLDFCC